MKRGRRTVPFKNFSYFQVWHTKRGFVAFLTMYGNPAKRTIGLMTSPDGVEWSAFQRIGQIKQGHYQVSAVATDGRAGSAFNYHPDKGLDWRTNLYYVETPDNGKRWRNAAGDALELPLKSPDNSALVHDYEAEGLKVYMKDILFDPENRPMIVYIVGKGYESGPENGPRVWKLARWTGKEWTISDITTSDSNYDMGSLYLEDDGLRLIAPTQQGPQPFNPGGEMAMWESKDGAAWTMTKQLTAGSDYNHTYARRPVNAASDFYAFWADGHARQVSDSRLYFCDRNGKVYRFPVSMKADTARPLEVTE